MNPEIVSALISSIVGGVLVAGINHLLTRRKTNAEIRHIELENQKLMLEIGRLQKELQEVKTTILERIPVGSNKSIAFVEEIHHLPGDFDNEQ